MIKLACVLSNHPAGIESRSAPLNRIFHPPNPSPRQTILAPVEKQRHHFLLEQVIDGLPFDLILIGQIVIFLAGADDPAAVGDIALTPPTVERTHIQNTVDRCFHAAGSTGLHRTTGIIEPDINTLHHITGDIHIVIFKENQPAAYFRML